jgi:hypothetical protein
MKPLRETRPRKPYESPRVLVYGDIREITRTTGNTSVNLDGGGVLHLKQTN